MMSEREKTFFRMRAFARIWGVELCLRANRPVMEVAGDFRDAFCVRADGTVFGLYRFGDTPRQAWRDFEAAVKTASRRSL